MTKKPTYPALPIPGAPTLRARVVDDYHREVLDQAGRVLGTVRFEREVRAGLVRWGYRTPGRRDLLNLRDAARVLAGAVG